MADFVTNNLTTTVTSCNYTTESFFNSVPQVCGQYINALQTCPTSSVTPAARLHAANQTAYCMEVFWQKSWYNDFPNYSLNYTNEDPVTIEANPGCHYPGFLPILQKTCSHDLSRLNASCSSTFNNTGLSNSDVFTLCETEAAIQYVRCTLQKSPDDVESCVANNAVKIDWLPQIQSYTGASSCSSVDLYLIFHGIHIFRVVFGALFSVLVWPKVVMAAKQKFKSLYKQQRGKKEFIELQDQIQSTSRDDKAAGHLELSSWVLEKRYNLKATMLLQSIGGEVFTSYITVLVLSQSGIFASSSFSEEISFYLVRPRAAPFLGLLGLFKPWSQKGLAALIVDGMLSFVAGTNVAAKYWTLVNTPPDNPAAPVSDLKTLAVGAIMTCLPAFAVLVITFLVSMAMTAESDGDKRRRDEDSGCASLIAGLCVWSLWLLVIAAFICMLPLVALVEMVAAVVLTIRRKLKKRKNKANGGGDDNSDNEDSSQDVARQSTWWEEPLTTTSGKFRFLYAVFILSSFVINIGNWLFFASYLKLEGEMYCPTDTAQVIAVWILLPLGIDLLFYGFRAWTSDAGFDPHPQDSALQATPL